MGLRCRRRWAFLFADFCTVAAAVVHFPTEGNGPTVLRRLGQLIFNFALCLEVSCYSLNVSRILPLLHSTEPRGFVRSEKPVYFSLSVPSHLRSSRQQNIKKGKRWRFGGMGSSLLPSLSLLKMFFISVFNVSSGRAHKFHEQVSLPP